VSLRPFRVVLGTPQVPWLLGSAIVGRMPTGMVALAIVLQVRHAGGSYATAGLAAGSYSVALGVSSPVLGRLVDRVGQTRVLLACAAASVLAFAGLAVAAASGRFWLLSPVAALAGAALPPVSACLRALWSSVLGRGPELQAAFAVESVVQELIFIAGPPLVAGLATLASPAVATASIGVLVAVGVGTFAAAPASRSWRPERPADPEGSGEPLAGAGPRRRDHWAGPLRSRGIRTVLAAIVLLAFAFSTVEVAVPAVAERLGSRALAGPLLAVWGVGSLLGGLLLGSRGGGVGPERRLVRLLGLMAAGIGLLALVDGRVQLGAGLLLAGIGIAPAIACLYLLVDRLAPAGSLTEAFTWVTSAFSAGIASGSALGGLVVSRAGTDAAFLLAASAVVATALLAAARRPSLAAPPAPVRGGRAGRPGRPAPPRSPGRGRR
jgi:MFS family permease